jgi:hypothetical protein
MDFELKGVHFLFEAIEAYSKDGKRIVQDLSVINSYQEGKEALKEYSEKHKKDKSREINFTHKWS